MHLPNLLTLLFAANHLISVGAFLTHESIRNLTILTDGCRERITDGEDGENVVQVLGGGQVVLQSGHEDGDEVEDVSSCFSSCVGKGISGKKGGMIEK
jgi:hypothetical protein